MIEDLIANTPPLVSFLLGASMMAAFQKRTTQLLDRFFPTGVNNE